MTDTPPVKKDEEINESDIAEAIGHIYKECNTESWENYQCFCKLEERVKRIMILIAKERLRLNKIHNEETAKLARDSFNKGYETAIDERKGK